MRFTHLHTGDKVQGRRKLADSYARHQLNIVLFKESNAKMLVHVRIVYTFKRMCSRPPWRQQKHRYRCANQQAAGFQRLSSRCLGWN